MNLKELMIACSGVDEHKMPKASVVLANDLWTKDGEKEEVESMSTDAPIVQFFAGDGFVTLDLDFGSRHNVDLDMVNDFLNNFRVVENSVNDDEDDDDESVKIPVTTVAIVPRDYEGQYFVACVNPIIHCLTAHKSNKDLAIIRMTFLADSVAKYEDSDFDPDFDPDKYLDESKEEDE